MALKPLEQEQVQGTMQVLLAYLDNPANSVPNNLVEAMFSAKNIVRGILGGQLFLCEEAALAPPELREVPEVEEA